MLPQVALSIAANCLIFGQIRLLKIVAAAQQQLEGIPRTQMPIELRGCTRPLAKIVKFSRLGRVEEAARGKSINKEVVAKTMILATVIGIEIIIFTSRATEIYVTVAREIGARTSSD